MTLLEVVTFPSPCKKKACGCKIMPLKFVSTFLCALRKVKSDFSQWFKCRNFLKVKFSCEAAYDNFLVSCRAKLTAPLYNNEDVAYIFVQKYSCRTKSYNWWRLYLHRMYALLFALFKILHQVRVLQCFQAASYFCVGWRDLLSVAWFSSQWFSLLEHRKCLASSEQLKDRAVQFMVLALITHSYYLSGCPVWNRL